MIQTCGPAEYLANGQQPSFLAKPMEGMFNGRSCTVIDLTYEEKKSLYAGGSCDACLKCLSCGLSLFIVAGSIALIVTGIIFGPVASIIIGSLLLLEECCRSAHPDCLMYDKT